MLNFFHAQSNFNSISESCLTRSELRAVTVCAADSRASVAIESAAKFETAALAHVQSTIFLYRQACFCFH